jgi:hypothetical protein
MVTSKGSKGSGSLIEALLPAPQKCRGLANALVARAMLRLGEDKLDDAWQDLLACHRLSRLVGRGGTLIEGLVGIAVDGQAAKADLTYLERIRTDAKRIDNCLRDLQKLRPPAALADKVNLGERFSVLDTIMMVDRHGLGYVEALAGGQFKNADPLGEELAELIVKDIDWDPALRNANRWFDRMAAAARGQDRPIREKDWSRIESDLKALRVKVVDSGGPAEALLEGKDDPKNRGKIMGNVIVCLMTPAIHKVQNAWDRMTQTHDNLRLAFALARFHCDYGHYPKTLDVLAPKYLDHVPADIFSGKALIYRPSETGYLVYSVGINGKDDGGRGYDDEPPGDDLVIRMPLPELKQK